MNVKVSEFPYHIYNAKDEVVAGPFFSLSYAYNILCESYATMEALEAKHGVTVFNSPVAYGATST